MVGEVQYGGRITDNLDRELFNSYCQLWLTDAVFQQNYCFNQAVTEFHYHIPDASEHSRFMEYIEKMPGNDTPAIFGLHPNADLSFRLLESSLMINTLLDIQPKDAGGGGSGKSREEEVKDKLQKELMPMLPPDYVELEVKEKLKVTKGPKGLGEPGKYDFMVPLNIFLKQEIDRFTMILTIVKTTMT